MPKENNDQYNELLDWLSLNGYFEHLSSKGAGYYADTTSNKRFCSDKDSLKENIINIAVQVAKYLIEVKK